MASELDEIRQQFPEYAGWSDQKLGRALKKKAQPDMPDDEYWGQLGVDPNGLTMGGQPFQPQGQQPQGEQPPGQPEQELGGMEKFYRASGIHGANKGFANIFGFGQHVKDANQKAEEAAKTHPFATGAGEFAADVYSSVPFFMAGGGAARGAGLTGKAAKIAGAGLGGAGIGAVEKIGDDESRLGNIGKDAAVAAALETIIPYAGRALRKLNPMNLAPTNIIASKAGNALPTSQILENQALAAGTETPIGDVVGSGYLKKAFENEVAPLSGHVADDAYSRVGTQLQDKGNSLLNKLTKTNGKDINYDIRDTLKTAYEKQKTLKNNLYDQVSNTAEKDKFKLELPSATKLAKETAKAFEDSTLLKTDPKAKQIYNRLFGFQDPVKKVESVIVDPTGKPLISKTINPSIKEVNYLANTIEEAGKAAASSPNADDRLTAGLYKRFANTLRADVRSQVESKGSDALKNQYSTATDNYKKNFSKFLDKDFYKLINSDKEPEALIRDIIRPGKGDRFKRIEKIQTLLPKDKQHALARGFLEDAIDPVYGLNPQKMASLTKSLGKRQANALFPDAALKKEVLDYRKLSNMNNEASKRLFNPNTGQRNITPIQSAMKGGLAAIGASAGLATGGLTAAPFAAIAGYKAPELISKSLAKTFTSEKSRDKIIEKIIKKRNITDKDMSILSEILKGGLTPSDYKESK